MVVFEKVCMTPMTLNQKYGIEICSKYSNSNSRQGVWQWQGRDTGWQRFHLELSPVFVQLVAQSPSWAINQFLSTMKIWFLFVFSTVVYCIKYFQQCFPVLKFVALISKHGEMIYKERRPCTFSKRKFSLYLAPWNDRIWQNWKVDVGQSLCWLPFDKIHKKCSTTTGFEPASPRFQVYLVKYVRLLVIVVLYQLSYAADVVSLELYQGEPYSS